MDERDPGWRGRGYRDGAGDVARLHRLVFLAIVGGATESGSAVAMAHANRMDLAVGIALGSCIQIALFIAPVLVLASSGVRCTWRC